MPQVSNITLGEAVSLPVIADVLLRSVPSQPGAVSKSWENSPDGTPQLATRVSAATRRKTDYSQSSMLRVNKPILRTIADENTRVGANIVEVNCSFDKNSTSAERAEALTLAFRAAMHAFFQAMIVDGEDIN